MGALTRISLLWTNGHQSPFVDGSEHASEMCLPNSWEIIYTKEYIYVKPLTEGYS